MVNWKKRIINFDKNGLQPGEEITGVASLQPIGSLTEATGRASFGLLGMFVSRKITSGKKQDNELKASALSKSFPDGVVIVAVLSSGRIIVYEQSAMSGKPKSIKKEFVREDFIVSDIQKSMLKSDMYLTFKDGGVRGFEAAKGQKLDVFAASLTG